MTRSLYLKMLHWYGLGHKAPSAVAGPPCRWPGDRGLPARLNEPRVEASALRGRTGCEWGLPNNHYSPPLGICKNDLWQICLISMDVGLWIPSLDRPPPPCFCFLPVNVSGVTCIRKTQGELRFLFVFLWVQWQVDAHLRGKTLLILTGPGKQHGDSNKYFKFEHLIKKKDLLFSSITNLISVKRNLSSVALCEVSSIFTSFKGFVFSEPSPESSLMWFSEPTK